MPREKLQYVCETCGAAQPKWSGRCPRCGEWNTLRGVDAGRRGPKPATAATATEVPLAELPGGATRRVRLGVPDLDRVLGGGVVPGSLVLVAGEPGIGKSTLMLQIAGLVEERGDGVLYVSAEESPGQLKLRAERLGLGGAGVRVLSDTGLESVEDALRRTRPAACIIDSIQTISTADLDAGPGTVSQVRECAARLQRCAKQDGVTVFLVGHVTKSGDIAGPRLLEHMVDTVLYLEGSRLHDLRWLRAVKNRFGATDDVAVLQMREEGVVPVDDPSQSLLAERLAGAPGSAVTVSLEGTRPLLAEVQALVSRSAGPAPRRVADGMDTSRLVVLAAVLSRRAGVELGDHDVFVRVVGGLRLTEPAVDLAVAAAVASSARGAPIDAATVVFGEIGLTGELRSVPHSGRRLSEARRMGFARALLPAASARGGARHEGIEAVGAPSLAEALRLVLPGRHSA